MSVKRTWLVMNHAHDYTISFQLSRSPAFQQPQLQAGVFFFIDKTLIWFTFTRIKEVYIMID